MPDVVLSPQTIALVGGLLTTMALVISALSGGIAYLYRQHAKLYERLLTEHDQARDRLLAERDLRLTERDRVLAERDARLVDLWRQMEGNEIEVTTRRVESERLSKLAADATEGWLEQARASRAIPS
jgi:uncharacterized protein YpmB